MMKHLFKTLAFVVVGSLTFTSCTKDNNDDITEQYREQELRIDSILNAQALDIEEYVADNLPDAEQDDIYYPYNYIDKETKRGFWYKLDNSAVEDDSYEYKWTAAGLTLPKVKLNYTAKLLDGTLVESATGEDFDFKVQSPVINYAWLYSFVPYSVRFNGEDKILEGLTEKGLKKGSKITVITPSVLAYGSTKKTGGVSDIPANSPLVYEFEVLEIE